MLAIISAQAGVKRKGRSKPTIAGPAEFLRMMGVRAPKGDAMAVSARGTTAVTPEIAQQMGLKRR